MALMIPEIDPATIDNIGESIVYRELQRQLPADWVVRYNYTYCRRTSRHLRDGEADFIVVVPQQGIVFLEVKSSFGFLFDADGRCYRLSRDGGRELSENPFNQASRTKHEIIESIICRKLNCSKTDFPGTYGHAVVLPRGKIVGSVPASQDRSSVITYTDMPHLKSRLEGIFGNWGDTLRSRQFDATRSRQVIDILRDQASFITVAAAEADEHSSTIEELTKQQYEAYRGVLANRTAVIEGIAGSGKTMLALWTAAEFAREGRSLLLCFNNSLAQWLTVQLSECANLDATTFHSLCFRLAKLAGIRHSKRDDDPQFWSDFAPGLLADAIDILRDDALYDTVIVDEAQDFHPSWWIPIELLLKNETSRFYLFYDPEQAIQFKGDASYPSIPTTFSLQTNCRNSHQVAKYCGNVVGKQFQSFARAPVGVPPVVAPVSHSVDARASICITAIRTWLAEGFLPSRIALLSALPAFSTHSTLSLIGSRRVAGIPFVDGENGISAWLDGGGVWQSTVKRFKGLEADCVIVSDVPGAFSDWFSKRDLYVAASRGKFHVLFIPCDQDASALLHRFLLDM